MSRGHTGALQNWHKDQIVLKPGHIEWTIECDSLVSIKLMRIVLECNFLKNRYRQLLQNAIVSNICSQTI